MDNLHPDQASSMNTQKVTDAITSNHPGGVMTGFCDGHTRFLQTSIDKIVFMQLMTPNDRGAGEYDTSTPPVNGIRDPINADPLATPPSPPYCALRWMNRRYRNGMAFQ